MIARGCAVNGANTVLIDINEKALAEVKAELEHLISQSDDVFGKIIMCVDRD